MYKRQIQAVVVLYPLHKAAGLKYINISTYQSVAGTGKAAIESLRDGAKAAIKGEEYGDDVYPHNIAFNLLPHIGPFDEEGISEEEWKMVNESRKIMHIPGLRVDVYKRQDTKSGECRLTDGGTITWSDR